jgi:hypothetical protein
MSRSHASRGTSIALPSEVGPVLAAGVGGASVAFRDTWRATDSGVTSHMRPPVGPEPITALIEPLLAHDLSRLTGTPNLLSASLSGIRPPNSTARVASSVVPRPAIDEGLGGVDGLRSHRNAGSSGMGGG